MRKIRITALTGLLIIISLAIASVSLAGSIAAVHGHSGDIQDMNHINSSTPKMGWGLDFVENTGTYNWIHYSIPTIPFTKTRYLLVRYETGETNKNADVSLTQFHVWDGEKKIYECRVNLKGGPDLAVIDMGEDKTISWGLGLSIQVGAGVEQDPHVSHRVRIYAVWAECH